MIILPNKNEKFVKEMDSMIFSDDIEERIISNVLKQKKTNRNIYAALAALTAFCLCFLAAKYINIPDEKKSEFLYEEDTKRMGYVSSVKDVRVDIDKNIDNLEISPNQMVILNVQNMKSDAGFLSLKGHIVGDDKKYSLGYIVDKKYTELLSNCTEEFVSNEMEMKDGTEYSMYIINCSDKVLTFSGNISINSNHLVYRDYGNEAVRVGANCRIIIDLSGLSNHDLEGVFVYNCITRQTVKFRFSSMIGYENEQEGAYLIYAMTVDGERIDLSGNVTVEYQIEEGNGVIGL